MSKQLTDQDSIIRQLIKDNLQMQARVRMLEQIVASCIVGPRSWGKGMIQHIMAEGDSDGVFDRKKAMMLECTIGEVLEESPLTSFLSPEQIAEVKNFEPTEL